ncbi:MAG: hypothetical protein HWN69_00560 [Desulfobacterales bacterium]|nr:hypothetical protein [Desulfobacterales bacterium]
MPNGVVNTKIERPSAEVVERFKELPTSIISDAMNRSNAMHAEIKCLNSNIKMVGTAVTVKGMVGCNIMSHKAIYVAEPGDVIVFDARGHTDTSVWGFLQTKACVLRGITGIVIDGSVRDSLEIRQSGLPVFCRGITPAGPHKGWGDSVNVPIQCGGVPVSPGDIIVGDDDGVIVVPGGQATEILKKAEAEMTKEEDWFKKLDEGQTTLEILSLDEKIAEMGVKVI